MVQEAVQDDCLYLVLVIYIAVWAFCLGTTVDSWKAKQSVLTDGSGATFLRMSSNDSFARIPFTRFITFFYSSNPFPWKDVWLINPMPISDNRFVHHREIYKCIMTIMSAEYASGKPGEMEYLDFGIRGNNIQGKIVQSAMAVRSVSVYRTVPLEVLYFPHNN